MNEGRDVKIRALIDLADARMLELVALMKPILGYGGFTKEDRQVLICLSTASARTSGSVLVLLEFGKTWDAEILSRTVFEGTLKFCHLLSDRDQFRARLTEYEQILTDINSLADHEKVERLIAVFPGKDKTALEPLKKLVLPEKQRETIRHQYPKQDRRRLQTTWGFTGLIEQMVRSGDGMGALAAGLLHGFAMASHVANADYIGVGMVVEREYRESERREAVHYAHAARVISDQLWYCALRLIVGYRFIGEPIEPISKLMSDGSELEQRLSEAQRDWYRVEYGVACSRCAPFARPESGSSFLRTEPEHGGVVLRQALKVRIHCAPFGKPF